MLSLVVLFTVFVGLVGVLTLLTALQNKWKKHKAQAPRLLKTQIENWLHSNQLHLPTPRELIPVFNERLREWLEQEQTVSSPSAAFNQLFIKPPLYYILHIYIS